MADWTGNSKSAFTTLGASNHSTEDRATDDYYATEPKATELLLQIEQLDKNIWECACGEGHMAKVLTAHGHNVLATDLKDRGYGILNIDFLKCTEPFDGDIVTNPPYKYAQEFVEKALELVTDGHKVCMFLKLQFLEGKARRKLFEATPPRTVWVSSSRLLCAKNGDFASAPSAVCYGWFVWEKGYKGDTIVRWFN